VKGCGTQKYFPSLSFRPPASGIFSVSLAQLISETEVAAAQALGQFTAWKKSGLVNRVRWITQVDERTCGPCEMNDGQIVELGQPFPSGDRYPGGHPHCRCVLETA